MADELLVGESLSDDADDRLEKPALVVIFPFVEPERLLVQVAKKVEGFDADIRALDRPLEQRPEVFRGRWCEHGRWRSSPHGQ